MSYVKNFDIGNIRADLPENQYTYDLPLLSFCDVRHSVNLSLVFNSKYANENSFCIANGFKLNLQKKLILQSGLPNIYVDSDGSRINLFQQSNNSYTFDDDSQRIIRKIGNSFVLKNPDYSTETFGSNGQITFVSDKYNQPYLAYAYTNNKLTSIFYRDKVINITYNNLGAIADFEYMCAGTSICNTTISYNENASVAINHYSGVNYYAVYSSGNFTAYSANGSTYADFSEKIICTKGTDSLLIEKYYGPNIVDRINYAFLKADDQTDYTAVNITDFHGVVTRVQYENKKPVYSYEVMNITNSEWEDMFIASDDHNFVYNGTVFTNKDDVTGKQGINDGLKMGYYGQDDWNCKFSSITNLYGDFVFSGWILPDNSSTCRFKINGQLIDYAVTNLIPDKWNYFSFKCYFSNPQEIYLTLDHGMIGRDLRITFTEGRIYDTDEFTHIVSTKDVIVIEGDTPNNDTVLFFKDVKFYNGDTELEENITATDVLKYKINQSFGTNTNEIYYNECKGIIPSAGDFKIGYETTDNVITKVNVCNVAVGKYSKKDDKIYYTKTNYYVNSSNIGYWASKTVVNNQEIRHEIYDDHLDLAYFIDDGITTTYTRTNGLLKSKTIGGNLIISATYDEGCTKLLSTTDEFGAVTNYTTDPVWGVITQSTIVNGSNITDIFDDDKTNLLSRTFGDSLDTKQHEFTYFTSGLLYMLKNDTLDYTFGYSSGVLSSVVKNTSSMEYLSISNDKKTVTAYYPSLINPQYTITHKTDNYGRTTEITGLIKNTYDIKPTHTLVSYNIVGVDNASGKLAVSEDLITGNVTKYAYAGDKLVKITVYDSNEEEVSDQTFIYDNANRITNSVYTYDPGTIDKSTRTIFEYVDSETDAYIDNRVKTCKYNLNFSTKSRTDNEYDSLKRLSQKKVTISGAEFTKVFEYDGTKLAQIGEMYNPGDLTNEMNLAVNSYGYDNRGRITSDTYSFNNQNKLNKYTYDIFGQLIREDNKILDKTFIYCYDNIGNITNVKTYAYTTEEAPTGSFTQKTFSYGDNTNPDRLTQYGYFSISYNSLGCPIAYGDKLYTWTKGKLTRMYDNVDEDSSNSSESIRFGYDAYGNRISKVYEYDPGPDYSGDFLVRSSVTYDYDHSGRLIREVCTEDFTESSSKTREFIYLYDEIGIIGTLYRYDGTSLAPYYYRRNAQGDVVAIYDQYGSRKAEYAYDAFGNCTIINSSLYDLAQNNPIRYRGYYYDKETKLYYLNSRYYNPEWRRFISPDSPDYLDPETPNGLNLYAYCYNDPVNYVDPSGHTPKWLQVLAIGLAIVGTVLVAGAITALTFGVGTTIMATTVAGTIIRGAAIGTLIGAGVGVVTGGVVGGLVSDWSAEGILLGMGVGFGALAFAGAVIGGSIGAFQYASAVNHWGTAGGRTAQQNMIHHFNKHVIKEGHEYLGKNVVQYTRNARIFFKNNSALMKLTKTGNYSIRAAFLGHKVGGFYNASGLVFSFF